MQRVLLLQGLLDVPEGVVGHSSQDLSSEGRAKAFSIRILQVLDVVVFLALFEHGELFVEHGVELIDGQVVHSLDLVEERDSEVIVILLEGAVNGVLVAEHVVQLAKTSIVHSVVDFLVGHVVVESAVFITFGAGKRVEDALGKGTDLVLALGRSDHRLLRSCVVLGKLLLVFVELAVFSRRVREQLFVSCLVIGEEDVVVVGLNVVLLNLGEVGLDLRLVSRVLIGGLLFTLFRGLSHLDQLEADTLGPVLVELLQLLLSEEGRGRQLVAPEWLVASLGCLPWVASMLVHNHLLVVARKTESPHVLLVELVINQRHVRVRRVGVDGLTLLVVEVEQGIVIVDGNDGGVALHIFGLGLERLHPLEVVVLVKRVTVNIIVMGRVLVDVGVPAVELVVNEVLKHQAFSDGTALNVETIVDLDGGVLIVLSLRIQASGVKGASESFALTVLVDCPHAVNTLANVLIGSSACEVDWCKEPEEHILGLQLEEGRPEGKSGNFIKTEGGSGDSVASEIRVSADRLNLFGGVGSELLVRILLAQNCELLIN